MGWPLLARIGLDEKADEYPDRLSGGQQQRVAIVRALAMGPRLLLLDEITSALDPELVSEVLDIVRELAAEGMTMLLATHEMGFAKEVASKVVFLSEGVVCEEGPPEQIFEDPTEERTRAFLRRIIEAGRLLARKSVARRSHAPIHQFTDAGEYQRCRRPSTSPEGRQRAVTDRPTSTPSTPSRPGGGSPKGRQPAGRDGRSPGASTSSTRRCCWPTPGRCSASTSTRWSSRSWC